VSALVGSRVAALAVAAGLAAAVGAPALAAAGAEASGARPGATARGDPANGERIYGRCLACHALQYDRTGPRHCGLLGRKAGSVPGFDYSEAMKRSGIVWNAATLDRFLADPLGTVPGTTMGYAGIADARERADLIAYLGQAKCATAANPAR
jgi:cytochrome c